MRSSRASVNERSGRESVFTRPAHLDALVARVEAGESFLHEDDDPPDRADRYSDRYGDRSDRYGDRADRYDRYAGRDMDDRASDESPSGVGSSRPHSSRKESDASDRPKVMQLEIALEDTTRELEVTSIQVRGAACARALAASSRVRVPRRTTTCTASCGRSAWSSSCTSGTAESSRRRSS